MLSFLKRDKSAIGRSRYQRLGDEIAAGAGGHPRATGRATRGRVRRWPQHRRSAVRGDGIGPAFLRRGRRSNGASARRDTHPGSRARFDRRFANSRSSQTVVARVAGATGATARCFTGLAIRYPDCGRKRRRKNDFHRQAHTTIPGRGEIRSSGSRRYIPCRSARTVESLGRAQQRHRHFAGRGRHRRSRVRCNPVGEGARESTWSSRIRPDACRRSCI